MLRKSTLSLWVGLLFISVFLMGNGQSDPQKPLYKQANASIDDRVDDLLGRMRLEEKLAQVVCTWVGKGNLRKPDGSFSPDSAKKYLPHGAGQIGRPGEGHASVNTPGPGPRYTADFTNTVQKYFLEETRLGIPVMFHGECLHGYASKDGTSYPQPIAIASSWNPEMVEEMFAQISLEARSQGIHQALTPVLDVSREPRWGRTEETYGEDPYLASEIGLAAIYGFQGRSGKIDENHVVATLKHLSGHGQPESGTNIAPANISRRVLREVFLYPFKKAVMEGGAKSVMPSYNEIDGVPSHGSSWLFETILRGEWGFNGTVVSDYGAVHELHGRHRIAKDHEDAAIKAMTIGVDMELPDPTAYPLLKAAIEGGRMDEKILDRSVKRILRHKFELGLFDKPFADPKKAERVVGSVEHMAFSQKVAEESIILLQNKNQLAPLSLGKKPRIALIGPNADVELQGGYSSVPKHFVTVKQGIEAYVGDKAEVRYAKGCGITEPGSWYLDPVERTDEAKDRKLIAEAVEVAQASDVIILAIGGNELTSREAWVESHMGDRTDLQMVGLQDDLVDALAATGKPILALLFNGRPLAVNNLVEKADAIFECWYLGQETGHAVARVIFGEVNPSGKLPITIPRSVGHVPAYYNHKPTARRGYLFDDVSPLWAFGEGMSYTTFSLSNPRLIKDNIKTYGSSAVEINVSNTGKMDGAEVVQMYVRDEYSSVTRPVMELKGFQKVFLKAGESKTVRIPIEHESLAFYNDKMEYVVEPGSFDIMLGTSSQSADLQHIRLTVQ